ncbi:hypothetical protein B0H10DRAFT_1956531 [Mycena sp. CBHHK59/15]|nr:hypothetical protein B0H10DRAFT_1956531 [Mycena sp. CBHHK59/15]
MAVSHHSQLYPLVHAGAADGNTANQAYQPSIYGASVGSNVPYVTLPRAPLSYDYGASLNSPILDGGAIRQLTPLPRLQIPSNHSGTDVPASSSHKRVERRETLHSATATTPPIAKYTGSSAYSPRFPGPLSAPDASEDFRYHQVYEEHPPAKQKAGGMPNSSNDEGEALSAGASGTERRSLSPARAVRRSTTSAVIACRQWCVVSSFLLPMLTYPFHEHSRSRKIRCDSTRPHCSNCSRRADSCVYDPAPRRRGPDKRPGTRQRRCKTRPDEETGEESASAKKKPRLEPASASSQISLPSPVPMPSPETPVDREPGAGGKKQTLKKSSLGDLADRVRHNPAPPPAAASLESISPTHIYGRPIRPLIRLPTNSPSTHHEPLRISTDDSVLMRRTQPPSSDARYTTPSSAYAYETAPFARAPPTPYERPLMVPSSGDHPKFPFLPSSSVQAAQQGWWDSFLRSYSLRDIATAITLLFSETSLSLSFLNVGFFLEQLWSPTLYITIQPAFILASLALATLIKSSETGEGMAGRDRAAWLRDSAQTALERAWREAVWLDASLAEAALLHADNPPPPLDYRPLRILRPPGVPPDRLLRALTFLDEIIGVLGPRRMPLRPRRRAARRRPELLRPRRAPAPPAGRRRLLQLHPPDTPTPDRDSIWSSVLPWDPTWSAREIRDEECRRLCWSALSLVTSYRAECMALARVDGCDGFSLCDPASFLVLFPNEVYDRTYNAAAGRQGKSGIVPRTSPKNALWALYCRSMLLTNFCANVANRQGESRAEKEDRAEVLQESWCEAQEIHDALDAHRCNLHTAVTYLCRENVYNMQGLEVGTRPGPLFNRRQAEEWIYYQAEVIKRVTMSIQYLTDPRGHQLTQRPFQVTWFYHQLAICLLLWENDTSLTDVLELAKSFLIPVDVMNALWPCSLIELQCNALRKRLVAHCRTAGREPPLPSTYTLPINS